MAAAAEFIPEPAHIPVLIGPLVAAVSPVRGVWLDGTFGAGGYTRALLAAGADKVIAMDRDPGVFEAEADWLTAQGDRVEAVEDNFARLEHYGSDLQGVVLDLGVSSMQLDQPGRGFSFMSDGPLDMRMSQSGPSAADLVAQRSEAELADILYLYGEERASRRIARAIVKARSVAPIETTFQLRQIVEGCLPRPKPGQTHPATRSFQAIRIAVNDELGALVDALGAAERALAPGGWLAVVTFHSIEDRIVKRFLQLRSGGAGGANRFQPERPDEAAGFTLPAKKQIGPSTEEVAANPRARSARLRIGQRTDAPAGAVDPKALGRPEVKNELRKVSR